MWILSIQYNPVNTLFLDLDSITQMNNIEHWNRVSMHMLIGRCTVMLLFLAW